MLGWLVTNYKIDILRSNGSRQQQRRLFLCQVSCIPSSVALTPSTLQLPEMGPALMAVWSKALTHLTVSCLSPQSGFEFYPGHVRKLPVTWVRWVFHQVLQFPPPDSKALPLTVTCLSPQSWCESHWGYMRKLGLGSGFHWVLRFPPPVTTG